MLTIENLNTFYGELQVLWDVSLKIAKGEIACLLGVNGAGKTTFLNTISGILPARSGNISFLGENIINKKPYEIVEKGIVQAPQGRLLFYQNDCFRKFRVRSI